MQGCRGRAAAVRYLPEGGAAVRAIVAFVVAAGLVLGPASAPAAGPGAPVAGGRPEAVAGRQRATVRPVPGPVLRGFQAPAHPYGPGHRGVALAAGPGEAVRAALPGTVHFSGAVARRGWVTVDHGAGLRTTYGWLDDRRVARHDRVAAGDVLGRLDPAVPHLHWGARLYGTYVDPMLLLGRWEVRLVPVW